MDEKLKTPTRKNGRHLRVPVLPSEEIQIKSKQGLRKATKWGSSHVTS